MTKPRDLPRGEHNHGAHVLTQALHLHEASKEKTSRQIPELHSLNKPCWPIDLSFFGHRNQALSKQETQGDPLY